MTKKTEINTSHIAPKYLDNILEILLGNIVTFLKYFETSLTEKNY